MELDNCFRLFFSFLPDMATTANHFMPATMLILGLLITLSLDLTVAQIGISYGRNGGGLPQPPQVVDLYKRYNIQRMRIYEPDGPVLDALSGSNIELTMSVLNRDLPSVVANAGGWVQTNVQNYPNVRFRQIVVGNEISPTSENSQLVLQAMQNVRSALFAAGLGDRIKVTTSIATDLLGKSFPPEESEFRPDAASYLSPIVRFLADTGAPIFASIYPYFSYIDNRGQINIGYALLQPGNSVTTPNGITYDNLFYALLDAVDAALERIVGPLSSELSDSRARVRPLPGESGWPSGGGPPASLDDVSSVGNAEIYINNLIQAVKRGTPKRPGEYIETYIFVMFDENQKPGGEDEKHFGLFTPDGQPKYNINFN